MSLPFIHSILGTYHRNSQRQDFIRAISQTFSPDVSPPMGWKCLLLVQRWEGKGCLFVLALHVDVISVISVWIVVFNTEERTLPHPSSRLQTKNLLRWNIFSAQNRKGLPWLKTFCDFFSSFSSWCHFYPLVLKHRDAVDDCLFQKEMIVRCFVFSNLGMILFGLPFNNKSWLLRLEGILVISFLNPLL